MRPFNLVSPSKTTAGAYFRARRARHGCNFSTRPSERSQRDLRRSGITHVSKTRPWQYSRQNYDTCHGDTSRWSVTWMFYDSDMIEKCQRACIPANKLLVTAPVIIRAKSTSGFTRLTACIFRRGWSLAPWEKSGCDFRAIPVAEENRRPTQMDEVRAQSGKASEPRKLPWSAIVLRENIETKGWRNPSARDLPFIPPRFLFSLPFAVTCFDSRVCPPNCSSLDCGVRNRYGCFGGHPCPGPVNISREFPSWRSALVFKLILQITRMIWSKLCMRLSHVGDRNLACGKRFEVLWIWPRNSAESLERF